MLLFLFPASLSEAPGLDRGGLRHFHTSCLQTAQAPPIIHLLMIISTLGVGPLGPLFLFWGIL